MCSKGRTDTMEDERTSRQQHAKYTLNRLALLCCILISAVALLLVSLFLTTLLTTTLQEPKLVPYPENLYRESFEKDSSPDNFQSIVLEPIKHILTSSLNLIGFSTKDQQSKSRWKRDLENENRIQMVDNNLLDREEKSDEEDEQAVANDFGTGIEGALQQTVRKGHTLKIVYVPVGGPEQTGHNNILRSLRRRRKRRAVETVGERNERKRRYAKEMQALEREYMQCRKDTSGEKDCEKIYQKLKRLAADIKEKFSEMNNLIENFKKLTDMNMNGDLSDSFPNKKKGEEDSKLKAVEDMIKKTQKKDKAEHELDPHSERPSYPEHFISSSTSTTSPSHDDSPWMSQPTKSYTTSTSSNTFSTTVSTTTQHEDRSLDELFKYINDSKTEFPVLFDPKKHNPVDDECVKDLDDLLKTVPEFRSVSASDSNCTKQQIAESVRIAPTEMPVFNQKNFQYDPANHKPIVDDCIQNLDDLLEAVDLESGKVKTPESCVKHPTTTISTISSTLSTISVTTTTVSPSLHRAADPGMFVDSFYHDFGQQAHPIHEELSDPSVEPQDLHDFIVARSRNRHQNNHDTVDQQLPATIEAPDTRSAASVSQPTVAASGPFLSLCDQLRTQANPGQPLKTLSSNQHHFQAQQYSGLGQTSIPVSGETLKTSSHVVLNSGYASPNHFCFYQVPPAYGAVKPVYTAGQHYNPGGKQLEYYPQVEPRGYPEGSIHIPVNIPGLPMHRSADHPEGQTAQLVCNLVVQPTSTSAEGISRAAVEEETPDVTTVADSESMVQLRGHGHCPHGKVPCSDGKQCIHKSKMCDNRVDCFDGSDESHCSCVSRIPEKRICDGYLDCPLGEDEMGCFGCDKFSFSCFNNIYEAQSAHHSETKCYTMIEKCDGFDNCLNRKDEQDCTMLVKHLRSPLAFVVGYSSGVLHRNYKGKWYPVCKRPMTLAKEACEAELGPLSHDPYIMERQGDLAGPFIQQNPRSHHVFAPEFTDTCNGMFIFVKCPEPKCGSSKLNDMQSGHFKVRNKRNTSETVQIVGGTQVEPGAYPFMVGIYRDGKFQCGGSIFNEHWVITAAHCCDNFYKHFYELKVGLLRRRSFSPHVQVSTVTHIFIHQGYNPEKMMNDISLMRSDRPFLYNRWVRPICLPERHMTTNDRDWMWGPKPGTLCTAIGWGALKESGGSPDHLKHVTIPIQPVCKAKNDREGLEICAAEDSGGYDACQGDSGGPFVCVSNSGSNEWYLAGVVSHGEGCARVGEQGVYTRVALFNEWIRQKVREPLPAAQTQQSCPGVQCTVGVSFCKHRKSRCNGRVDCLGAEDELHCPMDSFLRAKANDSSVESDETTMSTVATSTPVSTTVASTNGTDADAEASHHKISVVNSTSDAMATKHTTTKYGSASTSTEASTTISSSTSSLSTPTATAPKTKPFDFQATASLDAPKVNTTVDYKNVSDLTISASTKANGKVEETTASFKTTTSLSSSTAPASSVSSTTGTETSQTTAIPKTVTEKYTTSDITTPTTTHPVSTTDTVWTQVDKAIKNLKPHKLFHAAGSRTSNDSEDVSSEMTFDAVSLTTTTILPDLVTTACPGNATHHSNSSADMEASETKIKPAKVELTAQDNHPFLREIHELFEAKNHRLNQFHLSPHYLHTSMQNLSEVKLNEFYQYERFVCSRIHQSINIAHRCDRIIDCEDGTDEVNCTCRDFLKNKYDFLICDGKTDCLDLSDEENCFTCEPGTYRCRMSRVCIDEKKVCDNHPDCPLHEDELDCLALTDGHKVYFDANNLTMLNHEGVVSRNINGTWHLVCGAEITNHSKYSIGKICSVLGFAGHQNYSLGPLGNPVNESLILEHPALMIKSQMNITSEPDCKALHITCVRYINATEHEISHFENQHKELPVQVNIRPINPIDRPFDMKRITFQENAHIELIENFGDDYDWPWNTDIYLEGVFLCSAIIIDVNWIIVDSSCMRLINLRTDYIAVVAGGAKSYLKIAGPYEQIVRVNCYHFLPEARVVMLHLAQNLTYTRHVLPTFIPEKNHTIEDNQCLAVSQDKWGRTRTLRVHLNTTDCPSEKHICYQRDPEKGFYHADHCYSEAATRSGVVVCKTKLSGWYPVGFYQHKRGLCGFNEIVKMISLKEFYHDIQHVLSHQRCDYDFPAPPCEGLRCRYGKCIGESLICDSKIDCDDGLDELPESCKLKNETVDSCLSSELLCSNDQCVDKSMFCNGRNDCGDLTDEPHECSCFTYLKITDPVKICDGVRNCWDKSDENPRLCKCQATSFKCGNSSICIPYDHVCDEDIDCPGGEDEKYCYALQRNPAETNYGEVMQQSYGIWHTKCFPQNDTYNDQTIKKICESIGYQQIPKVYGRKMFHESRLRTANRTDHPVDRLRNAATKIVVLNKFSKVVVNEKHAFFMKPSRPLFKLVNWDAEDAKKCDRLEINCGD